MGEHRHNPKALALRENGQLSKHSARERELQSRFPPGSEVLGFQFETVLELNKEKLAEVTALADAAIAAGEDPRFAIPRWTPKDNPEFFDYVVYNKPSLGRPSALAIDPRQIPTAMIRYSEHLRIPLTELRARADGAFAEAEANREPRQ